MRGTTVAKNVNEYTAREHVAPQPRQATPLRNGMGVGRETPFSLPTTSFNSSPSIQEGGDQGASVYADRGDR